MKKFWILLAVAAFVSPIQADEAAEKVVKKAVEAHGGEKALLATKAGTMSFKASISVMGIDLDMNGEAAYAFPDKFKMSMSGELMGQKFTMTQLVNGDSVKMQVQGMDVPVEDKQKDELKQTISNQEISMIAPLLDAKKYTIKAEKDAKVGDNEASVILVTAKGMKDMKLFFDKKTNLLIQTQRQGLDPSGQKDVDEVTELLDYKKVEGIQTPMTLKTSQDGKPFMTMKMTEVKYLEKLDAKKFTDDK